MTIPNAPFRNYPARCSNTVWQKFKTFKDKARSKTKTGLGEKLTAAQTAWGKIVWNDLDAKKLKAATLKAAQANQVKARAALVIVEAAKKAVKAAQDKAEATKGNTALSDGAKNQAEVIVNGLKYGLTQLNKINIDDFEEEVKRLGG